MDAGYVMWMCHGETCFRPLKINEVQLCTYNSGTYLKGLSKLRTNLPIKDKFCSPNGTMLIHFYL